MPRYTDKQILRILKDAEKHGVMAAASKYGCHVTSIYYWRQNKRIKKLAKAA